VQSWVPTIVVLIWSMIVAGVLLAYFPENPLSAIVPDAVKMNSHALLPEGWAFFTKSPRSEVFDIFRSDGTAWRHAFRGPQSEPSNFFGLNRTTRAQGVEFGTIQDDVGKRFVSCSDTWQACAARIKVPIQLKNRSDAPLLCGDLVFVLWKPVPWNWVGFANYTNASRIAKVHLSCR
jgi:antimicrobial peptide system SdpA family protein